MAYSNPGAWQRPLRVCLVVPYDLGPEAGGVKQHSLHLKAALERAGDEVVLVGPTSHPHRQPHAPAKGIYALPGVVQVPVNGTVSAVGMRVSPLWLWRFFRRHRFDVVHLQEPQVPTMAWGICWLHPRLTKVATFHAADERDSIPWLRKLTGLMLFWSIARGITVSASAAKRTQQSWPRPLAVIPNGVCTDIFYPGSTPALPQGAAHSPPRLKLVYVGRLADKRKGARVLLEAFRQVRAQGLAVELLMVGDAAGFGPLPRAPGLRFQQNLSNEELAAAFRASDALVAPAIGQESFGMILLEAMACGKPVICSNIPGYMGVVRAAGAWVVPPNDAKALAAAMAAACQTPAPERQAMGQGNHSYAQAFAWDNIVQQTRAEYLAAMAAKKPAHRPSWPGLRRRLAAAKPRK